MRIVLAPTLPDEVVALARAHLPAGCTLVLSDPAHGQAFLEALRGATVLMGFVERLSEEAWQAAHELKLIQLLSAGYDQVDIARTRQAGVLVATNGGANAISVAEHTVMLMLAVLRQLPALDARTRAGQWRGGPMGALKLYELYGKTVGIIGMGRIGQEVAVRLRPFGVRLLYYDVVALPPEREAQLGASRVTLEDLLRTADIVTLHAPLTPQTRHLLNAQTLALLKPTAILINTARGERVDEAALVAALREGRLRGAGLDVFGQEPAPASNPLFSLPNVVVTPHVAGPTWDSWPRRFANAFENVRRLQRGERPLWVIPELADLPTP